MHSRPLDRLPEAVNAELVDPTELLSVAEFARKFPNIVASEAALRWLLRAREKNGLLAIGAVIELRAHPDQHRARLLVSPRQFISWARRRFGREQ
ncbi:MAG: hypothetical protein R3F24_05150 [Gammaproteobacteria bacterium]